MTDFRATAQCPRKVKMLEFSGTSPSPAFPPISVFLYHFGHVKSIPSTFSAPRLARGATDPRCPRKLRNPLNFRGHHIDLREKHRSRPGS